MALSYVHDGSDPVGYWYEAALPQREAFCMRDVSHQSVGAQILGLAEHNKNMFGKFAKISVRVRIGVRIGKLTVMTSRLLLIMPMIRNFGII